MDLSFSNLFKKKNESVLGIDIGTSSIKIVQLRKKGSKAMLETYGELALGPYDALSVGQATKLSTDKITEAMKDVLAEKEVNITTRECGIAIPFHASLLTVIPMPAVKEEELASMVPIEARKYIPVPISEVSLDWSIIPKSEVKENTEVADAFSKQAKKEGKSETVDILLAAIHKNIISTYQDIIRSAGLHASFFEIELFSSMRSSLDDTLHAAMIMDIGAASTKLYIVERGVLRSSHIINRGAQDITATIARINSIPFEEAEILKRDLGLNSREGEVNIAEAVQTTADYIFSETNRVIFSYQTQSKKNIEKIIMIGGGAALKGFGELARQSLNTETVLGDPFSKTEAPAFLEEILHQTGPEFAVSVGVALRKLSEL